MKTETVTKTTYKFEAGDIITQKGWHTVAIRQNNDNWHVSEGGTVNLSEVHDKDVERFLEIGTWSFVANTSTS